MVALLFFSVFAPLVEETAKSLTAWTIFDHLSSPAQGFAIGALSGTGFGMVESLLASVQPDLKLGHNVVGAWRNHHDAHSHRQPDGLGHCMVPRQ